MRDQTWGFWTLGFFIIVYFGLVFDLVNQTCTIYCTYTLTFNYLPSFFHIKYHSKGNMRSLHKICIICKHCAEPQKGPCIPPKLINYRLSRVYSSSASLPTSVSLWHAHSRAVVFHTLHIGQINTRLCPLIS